jgi:hypothetical protein
VEPVTDTLTFRWLPLNDIVHRIQNACEMGFNRRKLKDQRRETAEKEAARKRATDGQVLEDAERLIATWAERQARRMPMLFSPTIGAAIAARYWFLWIRCPACRTIDAIDLRTLDRHSNAVVTSLFPRCPVVHAARTRLSRGPYDFRGRASPMKCARTIGGGCCESEARRPRSCVVAKKRGRLHFLDPVSSLI